MKTIKFDGDYEKLHGQTHGKLVYIDIVRIDPATSDELIDYDTCRIDGTFYDLKYGSYLQLVFVGNKGIPFSTFRKYNAENEERYVRDTLKYEEFKFEVIRRDDV